MVHRRGTCDFVQATHREPSLNPFPSRHLPCIIAAKQPKPRANKSRAPSSADNGTPDVDASIKTSPTSQSDPTVLDRGQPEEIKQGSDTIETAAKRQEVMKACINTSAALAVTGLIIRQGTHWAAAGNSSIPDCLVLMPYGFEVWHLGVIAGTVALIASLRQMLLSVWPEFSQSSQSSNQQVLTSLDYPDDYLLVSFLPGISEEVLFRGALLPLIGVDWRGVAVSGLLFGILHITGGRNTAFAAWASFVGIVYGLAAIYTSNLAVPMVAHSAANIIAASLWRLREDSNMKDSR